MQRRKFLFYTHSLGGGGAERVWALLATAFSERGHDVVFAVDFASPENLHFLGAGVKLENLPPGHGRAVLALSRLLQSFAPDVALSAIGVSNLKLMLAAMPLGRARRCLISFHGFFPSEPQLLSALGNRLAPIFTRACGRAVAVSDGLREALVAQHGACPSRTIRIHNPVDFLGAPAALTKADLLARAPICLFVGRFSPDKDIPTLLEAFARVKMPEARLMIVGEGPLRGEIEAKIASLGLASRVTLAGYLADPAPAYLQARMLVLTSKRESFGNVIAEGLAHGLAIVSTATAGPSEILDGGQFGTLVPVGNAEALAGAIAAALAAPGDPAPRKARAEAFSVAKATDHYLATCEAIIAQA